MFGDFTRVTGVLLLLWTFTTAAVAEDGSVGRITSVECTTTAADDPFTIEVHHNWAPLGAQRFVELVEDDFFTDVAFFRCVENFLVQFGISPDPEKNMKWRERGSIPDDPSQGMEFKRGMVSFAGGGDNSRTTQMFITFRDLPHLGSPDAPWETPLGVVTRGMNTVVDKLYKGYGDQKGFNPGGVDQRKVQTDGNAYLRAEFPLLSYFKECRVVRDIDGPEPVMGAASMNELQENDPVLESLYSALSKGPKGGLEGEGKVGAKSPEHDSKISSLAVASVPVLFVGIVYCAWSKRTKSQRLSH